MAQSESINELAAALAKAQGAMKPAGKSAENPFFKSKYADLPAIVSACRIALAENNLAVVQRTDFDEARTFIETVLMHGSGQWISARYPVNPVKNDPQGMGSAVTYARRYSLAAIVGVVSDDDDDGNAASGKTTNGSGVKAAAPVSKPAPVEPPHDPETGEVGPHAIPKGGTVVEWGSKMIAAIKHSTALDELRSWMSQNAIMLDELERVAPKTYALIDKQFKSRLEVFEPTTAREPELNDSIQF